MQIGDTLYIQDENRRLYQDDQGNETNTPNARYKWRPFKIIDETKSSWILEFGLKASKDTLELRTHRQPGLGRFAHTTDQKEDQIWREMHAAAIYRAVQSCDTAMLRKVAALFGID